MSINLDYNTACTLYTYMHISAFLDPDQWASKAAAVPASPFLQDLSI